MVDGAGKRSIRGSAVTEIELGGIGPDGSLSTDSLRSPIPKGEYLVSLALACSGYTETGGGLDGPHRHSVPALRGLRPGDRVLVAWAGHDPVVVAIIQNS